MKKVQKFQAFFFVVIFLFSAILYPFLDYLLQDSVGTMLISFAVFLVVSAITIWQAWVQVPENTEYIVELFGKYIGEPLKPGLHYLFPWFGYFKIRKKVPMADQMIELYSDEKKEGGRRSDIEFLDCSSSVLAFLYFRVIDSAKATYYAGDIARFIEEKADGCLRSFLGLYKIDDAIKMKNKFTLRAIACCLDFNSNPDIQPSGREYRASEFYENLTRWGIEPLSFTISDIQLPEDVKVQRARKLTAEKDLEVTVIKEGQAEVEKRIKIVQAEALKQSRVKEGEGEKQYLTLEGEGQANKIRDLIEQGLPQEDIINLIVAGMKWTAVSKSNNTDKTIILDGNSNGNVMAGAEFGAGFRTSSAKGEPKGSDDPKKAEVKPAKSDKKPKN